MEDPLGEYRPLAPRYRIIAAILGLFAIIGGIMIIAVVFAILSGTTFSDWVFLVSFGGITVIAGLCGGYLSNRMANQMEERLTGPVLARWTYTEKEWDLMHGSDTGGVTKPFRTMYYFLLAALFPVLLILLVGVSSGTGIASPVLMYLLLFIVVMAVVSLMILQLVNWYRRHQVRRSRRQVLIAPMVLIKGDSNLWFFVPTLRTQEGNAKSIFSGFFSPFAGAVSGAVLDRVLLRKEDQWFLDFSMTVQGKYPQPVTLKILVPPGEERTAERVLEFFTPRQ